jgi:glycosyltransferase involved in cell wall biosynthesis
VNSSHHADITAVIPCFNHGEFLAEAVDSALGQRGGAPRVIVIDDGSTDATTGEAIANLPPEVETIRQPNAGPAAARNAGIERSATPLFALLDADDRFPDDALENLRAPLDAVPELSHSYGIMRLFGDLSGEVGFPDYDPYKLLYRSIIGGNGLIRRRVWEDVGGFDPDLGGIEDWDFFLGALERGWRGSRVPHVTLEYRKHSRSGLEEDRARYRALYRKLRAKHAGLYERSGELARESDLGPLGRLIYRTYWAWRPVPQRLERAVYARVFR